MQGRRRSRSFGVAIAVGALATLGACSSSDPSPSIHSPSPFFSSPAPTGTTSFTGPTGSTSTTGSGGGPTGGRPSTGPTGGGNGGGGPGKGPHGTLIVHVTGALQATRSLREIVTATYSPPGGGLAVVWTAGGTDASTVSIGGLSFLGSRETSTTLTLTITVPSSTAGFETFVSLSGECRVTMTRSTASAMAGSFRCANLKSTNGVAVDATATFSASG